MTYKPNTQRAKMAQIFLLVIIILYFIGLVSSFFEYRLINSWRMGAEVDMNTATANDLRQRIIAIFQIMVFIGSAITFIMWFRRAYYNLNRKVKLKYTDGWAAGAWFVPLLNLWRPFYMFKEMYMAVNAILSSDNYGQYKPLNRIFLGVWWIAWLINNFLGRISFQVSSKADTLDEYLNASTFDMIATGWGIATALLALKVVRDYASVEPLLFKEYSNTSETNFDPEILDS